MFASLNVFTEKYAVGLIIIIFLISVGLIISYVRWISFKNSWIKLFTKRQEDRFFIFFMWHNFSKCCFVWFWDSCIRMFYFCCFTYFLVSFAHKISRFSILFLFASNLFILLVSWYFKIYFSVFTPMIMHGILLVLVPVFSVLRVHLKELRIRGGLLELLLYASVFHSSKFFILAAQIFSIFCIKHVQNLGYLSKYVIFLQFPIGIDSERFIRALDTLPVQEHIRELKDRFKGRKVFVSCLHWCETKMKMKSIILVS